MKLILPLVMVGWILSYQQVCAADTANPTNELAALIGKINADIQAGKRTEADFSDDIKQYDALLAEHKGEKTDIMAQTMYMKMALYAEVIGDTNKADILMGQLKRDFSGTPLVMEIEKQEAREAAMAKIRDSLVEGTQFPNFDEKDVAGKPLSRANYRGKIVLVDFWATWCVPCRIELPNVINAYQKYHDKGFEVIGVTLDTEQQPMLDFTKENNMPWPQYFDGLRWDNKLAMKYGIESVPMNYLLDGNGKIIGESLRGDALSDAVAKAIADR
jgi:thiol-disulfide isomerase/thioredoxin